MRFRIRKGTHVSHFDEKCPLWPGDNFYEQDKPLWWGSVCAECAQLARKRGQDPFFEKGAGTPFAEKGS